MIEYISREAAVKAIEKHKDGMAKTGGVSKKGKAFYLTGQDHAIDVLRIVPAADVMPVVRCKDCKHYKDGWCYNPNTYDDEKTRGNTVPDWYCADGERREYHGD